MSVRRPLIAALVAVAVTTLGACTNAGTGTNTKQTAKSGGHATVLFPTAPLDLDPATSQDNNVSMPLWNSWFEYLVKQPPGQAAFQPMLAQSWQVSADKRVYTFRLRPGVMFSDGTSLTAADVVASLQRNYHPQISLLNFLNAKLAGISAPSQTEVRIALKQPWPHLLADLASPTSAIYSQKALAATQPKKFFTSAPVGTGPFTLTQVVPGSSYTVNRNPKYWDKSAAPHLDRITFNVVTDDSARATAVLGGRADVAQSPPGNQLKALSSNRAVRVATFPSARVELIVLNTRRPPFDNKQVRQAFSLALDRKAIISSGLFGYGQPATTFLVGPPEATFQNTALNLYPTDAAKARQLLQASGVRTPVTVPLEVSTGSDQDAILNVAQSNLAAIGMNVRASRKDAASVDNDIIGGNYTANTTFWGNISADPSIQPLFAIDPSYCCNAYFSGYRDPALIDLTHRAVNTDSPSQARQLFDQVQRGVADAAYLVPLYYPELTYLTRNTVTGFAVDPYGFTNWAQLGLTQ